MILARFLQRGNIFCLHGLGISEKLWVFMLKTNLAGIHLLFYFLFASSFCLLISTTVMYCASFEVVIYIPELNLGFFLVVMSSS